MANFYVDFVNGNDTTGTGTIALPWKTLTKATAVGGARTIGDVVYVAKTPGSITLIGNGSTANNQFTINTGGNYTGSLAAKDFISFDPSGFPVFQISTITSTLITLAHYPWFEAGSDTALSTVNIYKVPTIDVNLSTGNYDSIGVNGNEIPNIRNTPYDFNTTFGYNILITGGWNSAFTLQDGHTLVRNTNPAAGSSAANFIRGNTGVDGYKINRISGLNFTTYYSGSLSTENRMVWEDCYFGYGTSTNYTNCYMKNCKSYTGNNNMRFYLTVGGPGGVQYGNTPTETNAIRPMVENHTHFLSWSEYSTTTSGNPQANCRSYNYMYIKNNIFKSALRTSDVVNGQSNIGKFPILPVANATGNVLINPTITINPNITQPITRVLGPGSFFANEISIDATQLNSFTYSSNFANLFRTYNYIKSTNGDIFSIPGTFKTINGGDNSGVIPYCNNVIINNDGKRYQWDGNFVSSVDNTVYSAGTNSVKITKITDYVSQQSGFFIGDIELFQTAKTIQVVVRGSKNITNVGLSVYPRYIALNSGYFVQTVTRNDSTDQNFASTPTTISSTGWTTLSISIPNIDVNNSGKVKLSLFVAGGTNMVNNDNIWIDSITIS